MTVQQLIDKLNTIEDKSLHIVYYYDGWYINIDNEDIQELTLYTGDNGKNITDYDCRFSDDDVEIKCLQIAHGG